MRNDWKKSAVPASKLLEGKLDRYLRAGNRLAALQRELDAVLPAGLHGLVKVMAHRGTDLVLGIAPVMATHLRFAAPEILRDLRARSKNPALLQKIFVRPFTPGNDLAAIGPQAHPRPLSISTSSSAIASVRGAAASIQDDELADRLRHLAKNMESHAKKS